MADIKDLTPQDVEALDAQAEAALGEDDELAALLAQRTNTYILLSRLYLKEVDAALLDELHEMLYPMATGDGDVDQGYIEIATYLSNLWSESLTELAVDYVRCFLGNSVDSFGAAYPYESVYTSEKRLLMQDARDEVLAIYRANGIEKSEAWNEGEDHIALELEFMRVLNDRALRALKEGRDEDALRNLVSQRNFLQYHLVSWVPMMTADLKRFAKTRFYAGLAYLTDGFLRTDLALLQDLLAEVDLDPAEAAEEPGAPAGQDPRDV